MPLAPLSGALRADWLQIGTEIFDCVPAVDLNPQPLPDQGGNHPDPYTLGSSKGTSLGQREHAPRVQLPPRPHQRHNVKPARRNGHSQHIRPVGVVISETDRSHGSIIPSHFRREIHGAGRPIAALPGYEDALPTEGPVAQRAAPVHERTRGLVRVASLPSQLQVPRGAMRQTARLPPPGKRPTARWPANGVRAGTPLPRW